MIVDEIHAVAHSKRGSHLALTLERLEAARARRPRRRRPRRVGAAMQRIGLSATQSPLEEIGRFLVGPAAAQVTIVDAGARKQLDLRIEVPVESMAEPDGALAGRPAAGPARARRGRRVDARLDLAGDLPGAARSSYASTPPRSCSSTTAAPPSASRCA